MAIGPISSNFPSVAAMFSDIANMRGVARNSGVGFSPQMADTEPVAEDAIAPVSRFDPQASNVTISQQAQAAAQAYPPPVHYDASLPKSPFESTSSSDEDAASLPRGFAGTTSERGGEEFAEVNARASGADEMPGASESTEPSETTDTSEATASTEQSEADSSSQKAQASLARPRGNDGEPLTDDEIQTVQDLEARDQEVRNHEMAHIAASGGYAKGGASFSYQTGPDGKRYAVGGEVSIDTSAERDPQKTVAKMQAVRRAAMAPAEPSAQDRHVAAKAAQQEARAMQEMMKERMAERPSPTASSDETEAAGDTESGEASAATTASATGASIANRSDTPVEGNTPAGQITEATRTSASARGAEAASSGLASAGRAASVISMGAYAARSAYGFASLASAGMTASMTAVNMVA